MHIYGKILGLALATVLVPQVSSNMATAASASPSACKVVKFKIPPLWISSATWVEERSQLFVIDPVRNKILSYSQTGDLSVLPDIHVKGARDFQPNSISRIDDSGFGLELADGTLLRLDKEFRPIREMEPYRPKKAGGLHVASLYQWKVVGNSIVAFGALAKGEEVVKGFFSVPLDDNGKGPEMLPPSLTNSDYYLLGNSYITAIGDAAYYVAMDEHPAIYSAQSGRRLNAFPANLSLRPDFTTRMTGPKSAVAHYAELETFTVASGLYAQGGMLYLLSRTPSEAGRTAWFLHKIDPERDMLVGSVQLPTSAHHLTVVVSDKAWYFIERGPAEVLREKVEDMVVVNSSSIASLSPFPSHCPEK